MRHLVRGDEWPSQDQRENQRSQYIVYELHTGRHVATLRAHLTPWDLAREAAQLGWRYHGASLVVERNNHGHAVLQALIQEQKYPKVYLGRDGKPGWLTTSASRPMALDLLEDSHRRGLWKTNDRELLGEMLTFIVNERGRPEAAKGKHDDLVMAAAMGWDALTRPTAFRSFSNLPEA